MQPRICPYCWKTFSNSFNLKQHTINVHIQSQGVACEVCEKVVKTKWYLRKHLVTAHGAPLKRTKDSAANGKGGNAGQQAAATSSGPAARAAKTEAAAAASDDSEEEEIIVDEIEEENSKSCKGKTKGGANNKRGAKAQNAASSVLAVT